MYVSPEQAFRLALDHHRAGRLAPAEELYRRLTETVPDHAETYHLLSLVLRQTGRPREGLEFIRRAVTLVPGDARFHAALGFLSDDVGEHEAAAAAFNDALRLDPNHPDAHFGLGLTRSKQRRSDEAVATYRKCLELDPGNTDAALNLGIALADSGDLDAAEQTLRTLQRQMPGDPRLLNNLGNIYRSLGRFDEAVVLFRRALSLQPHLAEVRSNLIFTSLSHPTSPTGQIEEDLREWDRIHGHPPEAAQSHANDRSPERKLRVGLVSPDFRDHVIGRNVLPLFREHDREQFEFICFSDAVNEDALTETLRGHAARWHGTTRLDHAQLAELIRRERIDVLVDLTQHLGRNRLPAFALRPAPVQVSFAGYPGPTGVRAIEYRLTDAYLEPQAEDGVWKLPSFWCFEPFGEDLPVLPPPALINGFITFGCLNDSAKINGRVVELWSAVLRAVPNSRLLLLAPEGKFRDRLRMEFHRRQVDEGRIEFIARLPRTEYLRQYQRIDIVLDTVPYNGHTTTCEALWMGVPVVSRVGEAPVSRGGLSILSQIDFPQWAAATDAEYVGAAQRLAADRGAITALRAGMRGRMQRSSLMDAAGFAREIGAALREMWRRWCVR